MPHRPALLLGLLLAAPAALAQQAGTGPATQDAARQSALVDGQTVQSDLQAYVLMLQAVQEKLRAAEQDAAREESHEYSGGAMTPARQELMQQTREAWRAMQRVPPAVERTDTYAEVERELRHALGEIGPTRTLSREQGLEAARRAQRALDRLRLDAAQMAGAAGAPVPAVPVTGGGERPREPR